jgi:GYF domain 2
MANWFYLTDGQPTGPVEPAALKQLATTGRLKLTDKVRREDMAEWFEAKQVKGLFALQSTVSATTTGILPASAVTPPVVHPTSKSSA